ncbi:MAG: MATE family efflux transporter [Firmicutes bacterium]|nr:MATE family efflux transporter [Bacillota bacterium]
MTTQLLTSFSKYVSLNVLGMLGLCGYILADTFFVANGIGAEGLAALNLAISISSIINGTGLMLGIGGATRYNLQRSGNHSEEEGNRTFTVTVQLGLLVGLLYFLVGALLAEPLAQLLGADGSILPLTTTYLKTILCFAPGFILNNILIAFIRNDGSPNTAMAGMLTGSIANVILDYIFIFPWGMGMFGAAFATGLAPIISMAVMSPYFIKEKNGFHWQKGTGGLHLWSNICALGISSFVSEVASAVVLIVFNLLLLGLSGNVAVAAYGIIANLSLIAAAIFTGIGQGIQPLVSHYYGRGEVDTSKRLLRWAVVLSFGLAVALYLVILLFGEDIADLFNRDNDELLRSIATNGLLIYFTGFVFAGINILLSSFFSAIEEPKTGFLISILRGLIVVVPLALLLSLLWGINGVWLTFPITEALVFAVGAAKSRRLTDRSSSSEPLYSSPAGR